MFYEKLKKELEIRNTNLNQLAKATGINQSATSRYKSGGMPNTDALIKICRYLNVSADYLLDLDDEALPPDITELEQQNITFYEKLSKILIKKELNFNKLAKGCNIAQSQTSKWKKGYLPGSEILIKICKYLNISADYLLDLDEGPPPPVLTDQEQELLEHFRQCDKGTKENLMLLARAKADEIQKQETLLNSQNAG